MNKEHLLVDGKLLGLEIIRFISALAVLFWHYQHFSFVADKATNFVSINQPFYDFFSLLYRYGLYGVQIFWCISGFIFFWKYRSDIADGVIKARSFFVLRFSRLYPLHFATLFLVLALQAMYFLEHQYYFVYQKNDIEHFGLQLVFASNWFPTTYTFNGPIWSISVEVLIYCVFFLLLRLSSQVVITNLLVIGACVLLIKEGVSSSIVECLMYFYCGGVSAIALRSSRVCKLKNFIDVISIVFLISAPIAAFKLNLTGHWFFKQGFLLLYMPVVLFWCARDVRVPIRIQWIIETLGNMTYSSYLIHFPIQLAIALLYTYLGEGIPMYDYKFFMIYMFVTLALAYVIFVFFEKPAQDVIRRTAKNLNRNNA